ncbi:MAG TPA: hypothetical protein VIU41_15370 [Geobacteraceae bacterium]
MLAIMMENRMYTAVKAWRNMRREQLHQDYDRLVEMTLARSR